MIVSAVCHGPGSAPRFPTILLNTLTWNYSSGLVLGKDQHGKSIFEGRRATGFTNEEEEMATYSAEVSG